MSGVTWQDAAAEERAAVPAARTATGCAACGAALDGAFCSACGQERTAPDDLLLSHFARRAAEEVFDLDSRLLRTLRALVTRPGELTREFVAGRRRCYFGPFKLFLGVSLVYFVLVWPLVLAVQGPGPSRLEQSAVVAALASEKGMAPAELVRRFADGFQRNAKLLTDFVSIPMLALCLAAIQRRTRRRFAEHLIFAVHYATFHYLVSAGVVLLLLLGGWLSGTPAGVVPLAATYVAAVPYAWVAMRRVYGAAGAAPRTALFLLFEWSLNLVVGALAFASALYFA